MSKRERDGKPQRPRSSDAGCYQQATLGGEEEMESCASRVSNPSIGFYQAHKMTGDSCRIQTPCYGQQISKPGCGLRFDLLLKTKAGLQGADHDFKLTRFGDRLTGIIYESQIIRSQVEVHGLRYVWLKCDFPERA